VDPDPLDGRAGHPLDLAAEGIGELTSVATTLSLTSDVSQWELIITVAGLIYLAVTVILIQSLELFRKKLPPRERAAI
jgi:ABC-type arginine/histidine transport system permease subunit